ncbi:DsbA family oxidoreductase [Epilithonimonas arachidiradicis]|uniref:DSBA oxidoreductase n=1 Tax=Epilithonimonas arachidiradicis TaxID=1617282 RepID=A0A420D9T5_9FLAO|nr:DsbA family oxidoreductase [Epilithonimonas arachidiradicis]RKE87739.1 protein disulfide-isomerase [Epilithonimonas arachidiradicis]GGG57501.1 DSBA oxidoreductase [Epilithonimonas arachidiradicis]
MKVDIWSDTRCPFCFIGKKNFEKALRKFVQNDQVEVNWHSFQLDPNMKTDLSKNHYEYLSEIKGFPMPQIMQMHENLIQTGKNAGIDFNFDEVKVSNSFKSQMLVQFAKQKGKANEMEELLFEAYFISGKDIDDVAVLCEIGEKLGFTEEEIQKAVESPHLANLVNQDISAANSMGIRGVPFFVFNEKYGVSGAQPTDLFSEVLEKSWTEFSENNSKINIINEGDSCEIDGNC